MSACKICHINDLPDPRKLQRYLKNLKDDQDKIGNRVSYITMHFPLEEQGKAIKKLKDLGWKFYSKYISANYMDLHLMVTNQLHKGVCLDEKGFMGIAEECYYIELLPDSWPSGTKSSRIIHSKVYFDAAVQYGECNVFFRSRITAMPTATFNLIKDVCEEIGDLVKF